jgi:poly(3-hydroxyalkanoate) synthetase
VIAPSDLKWPATTPSSVPELFDFQRRYFKQSWWPDWDRWLKERSSGTKAGPAKLGNRKYKPIEPPPGRSLRQDQSRLGRNVRQSIDRRKP